MLFSKNKSVDLTKLKEENPDAYNALIDDVKAAINHEESVELTEANKKIEELTQQKERDALNTKITEYGKSLKVEETAKEAIEKKMSFDDALKLMIDAHTKNAEDIAASFEETASKAAGANLDDEDKELSEPKSFIEAIRIIAARDGITKAEAAQKAKIEYKDLFDKNYETAPKLEEEKDI